MFKFRSDPYFCQRNTENGIMEWFFLSREGTKGPFDSRQTAASARHAHAAYCQQQGIQGIRGNLGQAVKFA